MNDYHYLRVPAKKVEMVTDTTGAGDAFAAGFLANRLRQKSVKDCCSLGHEVASTVIQKYGAR
jgi:adenosine kinase